ncbi:MAG: hypothetical protein K2N72_11115 [Oscillospiraceae bacterium]|nr:hypothetical protein [Oscillospiraceae bacterium]
MSVKSLSIRIGEEMLAKLHYIADYEERSANGQVIILIRKCIDEFEKEHGEITYGNVQQKQLADDLHNS